MIDWEKFNDTYKHYGTEVVLEIIEILEEQFDELLPAIQQNITDKDFVALNNNAHKLKGGLLNFFDPEPVIYAYELELMGKNGQENGMDETLGKLMFTAQELLSELRQYRATLSK